MNGKTFPIEKGCWPSSWIEFAVRLLTARTVNRLGYLLVCVVFGLGPGCLAFGQAGYGNFRGQIIVSGEIPEPQPMKGTDQESSGPSAQASLLDRSLEVDDQRHLKGVFVYLRPARGQTITHHPDYDKLIDQPVTLVFHNGQLRQRNSVIWNRQTLCFDNLESAPYGFGIIAFRSSISDIPRAKGRYEPLQDLHNEPVPSQMRCAGYPEEAGYLKISDHPYHTFTAEDGRFSIEKIPAGVWQFHFWHNRCGYMRELTKDDKKILDRRGGIQVEIKDGETVDLGQLVMDMQYLEKPQ